MLYDVAIIGGGLAGLSLAIQCARQGYSTVLFEKETYPFHKVCGEYISLESKEFLEQLGFLLTNRNLPVIKKLHITDSTGRAYKFSLPLGGFGVSRYLLDDSLYHLATYNKVEVVTGCKVQDVKFIDDRFSLETTNGLHRAKVVAGSYGKRSNLDIQLKRSFVKTGNNKLNNYIAVKYHVRYPQASDTIALHNFNNGYCGISAIEDNKCCLCYLTTAQNLRTSANSISLLERSILSKNPHLKHIFSTAEHMYDHPLTISQVNFNSKTQVEKHLLMLGDAAGLITPLCGNGMSMAMHGSKLAFMAIRNYLENYTNRMEMEKNYINDWSKEFSTRLTAGRMIQRMFGGDVTTSVFLKMMNAVPSLAQRIIKLTHGDPF